jgi:hypothetical protein
MVVVDTAEDLVAEDIPAAMAVGMRPAAADMRMWHTLKPMRMSRTWPRITRQPCITVWAMRTLAEVVTRWSGVPLSGGPSFATL